MTSQGSAATRAGAELLGERRLGLLQPAGVRVADEDAGALLQESAGGRAADAGAGRGGDHGGTALQQAVAGYVLRPVVRHSSTLTYQTLVREGGRGPDGSRPTRAGEEAFRAEARAWLAAHVPAEPLPSLETAEGFAAHRAWEAQLHADRWSVVSWPRGVRRAGRRHLRAGWSSRRSTTRRARRAGSRRTASTCWPPRSSTTARTEQRARVLPPMASGEVIWAQAWSEPESGSDLASLKSRAVRTDGGWLLSGQKTWSSRAAFADRAFGIFRTDPDAPKPHQGLTYLMFDLSARRGDGPPDRPARRQARLRRALPRRCLRPRRGRDRRAGAGLADRDVHDRQRTRADAALPRPFPGRRGPSRTPVARRAATEPTPGACATGSRTR